MSLKNLLQIKTLMFLIKIKFINYFQDFQRSRAFLFLNEIKRRFLASYGPGIHTAIAYSMNTEFSRVLTNEMVIKIYLFIYLTLFGINNIY